MLSDFNCKIFNPDRIKLLDSAGYSSDAIREKINSDMAVLDSLGFHRLVCQVVYDENKSVALTLEKIRSVEDFIKDSVALSLRRKFNISVVPALALSENTPYVKNISALTIKNTNYILAELPISIVYPDYLDSTINKILYNCRLCPIFTKFDIFASIHRNTDHIERMTNIKDAAFQFSLNKKNFQNSIALMNYIHYKGGRVLLATDSEHDLFNAKRISENLTLLKEKLPRSVYLDIILSAHGFLL